MKTFIENLKENGIACGQGMLKGAIVATCVTVIVTVIETVIMLIADKKEAA